MERVVDLSHLKVPSQWYLLWALCDPQRWKLVFGVWFATAFLPNGAWVVEEFLAPILCVCCNVSTAISWHLLFECLASVRSLKELNLWDVMRPLFTQANDFLSLFFHAFVCLDVILLLWTCGVSGWPKLAALGLCALNSLIYQASWDGPFGAVERARESHSKAPI